MKTEKQIRVLLSDIETVVAVGLRENDLDSKCAKIAQIEIIRWILEDWDEDLNT